MFAIAAISAAITVPMEHQIHALIAIPLILLEPITQLLKHATATQDITKEALKFVCLAAIPA